MDTSFGESLSTILKIFNINGSKLAKGINIDQSLLYKWLRNERMPAHNSPYINLIANYLSESFNNNPFIKESVAELFPDKADIKSEIHNMLNQAHIYSLYLKDHEKLVIKGNSNSKTNSLLQGLQKEEHINKIRIIKGIEELLDSTLDLINHASKKAPKNPILILLNSNMAYLDQYGSVSWRWRNALLDAIQKGWEVIFLIRLNDNIRRTMRLIEDMLATLSTNGFHVYYINTKFEINVGNDLIIIPNVGALLFLSSNIKDQVDSAFLFEATESIDILTGHFYQFFSFAKPLYATYSSQKHIEFQKMLTIAEGRPGDRLVYRGGHSTIIVPSDLYKKYLKKTIPQEEEISQRLDLHNKRIVAFESQINNYKFREIWFKESIQRLIFEKDKERYILGNYIPDKDEIISYLKSIISMLQDHENYEVALVNRNDYQGFDGLSWMVKGSYVFLEAINDMKSERNLATTEENFVVAFHQYYQTIWDNIPQNDKDKQRVIDWINSLIQKV